MNFGEMLKDLKEKVTALTAIREESEKRISEATDAVDATKQTLKDSMLFELDIIPIIAELISIKEDESYIPFITKAVYKTNGYPIELGGKNNGKTFYGYKFTGKYYVFIDRADVVDSLANKKELKKYMTSKIYYNAEGDYGDGYFRSTICDEVSNADKKGYYFVSANCSDIKRLGNGVCLLFDLFNYNQHGIYFNSSDCYYYAKFEDRTGHYEYVHRFLEYLFDLQVQNNGKHLTYEEMKKEMQNFLANEESKPKTRIKRN